MHTTEIPIFDFMETKSQRYFLNAAIVVKLMLSQIENMSYEIANAITYVQYIYIYIYMSYRTVVSTCMEMM